MDEVEILDVAAPSHESPHLSPVLGRYFERSWSHGEGHRLYDTAGKALPRLRQRDRGHGARPPPPGGHRGDPRPGRPAHRPDRRDRLQRAGARSWPTCWPRRCPSPIDTIFFLNSGSEAIEAALKLARRATGRPAIIAFQGAFHGRTFGATSVTSSSLNYRAGYEPLLPAVYLTPFPAVYRDFGGDEELATRTCMDALAPPDVARSCRRRAWRPS